MSHPINELVVKVASRCNIDCDYCYEYNLGDSSWRLMQRKMSPAVIDALAARVREHAVAHRLDRFHIGLHGGEPLLIGAAGLRRIAGALRSAAAGDYEVDITLQTNAILATPEIAEAIVEHNIAVGVSIDGGPAANDRHRVDHQGRSTFDATFAGIQVLREHAPRQLSGVLSVIDVRNEPLEVLDFVGSLGVASVDFLLPHHNWDRAPPRPRGSPTEYADWYFTVYQAWVSGRQRHLRIRFLEHLIRQIVGGAGLYEQNTLAPVSLAVINTDGGYEGVDALKSTGTGAQRLGLNVREHSMDELLAHPKVAARQGGVNSLCETCRSCVRVDRCGGGYLPHRYRAGTEFHNPSVYCSDLFDLIGRIEDDIRRRARRSA